MIRANRRRFLERCSCGLAGVSLAGPVLLAPGRWRMRMSASSIAFSRLPIEEACARIAGLGFEGIDLWSAHAGCPHLDDVAQRLGAEGLRRLLDRHHLALTAFSVYAGGYPKYAELLGRAGGGLAITGSAGPCTPGELNTRMREYLAGLAGQVELAERYGSSLAIENHGESLLDSIDSIRAFVDLNRSPRLGIALAPFHVQARGESVVEAIRAAGPCLKFFYAWQHDSAMGLAQLPGIGPTNCGPWLEALAEVNYGGTVNPFLHDEPEPDAVEAALARSRDYLRGCHEAAMRR